MSQISKTNIIFLLPKKIEEFTTCEKNGIFTQLSIKSWLHWMGFCNETTTTTTKYIHQNNIVYDFEKGHTKFIQWRWECHKKLNQNSHPRINYSDAKRKMLRKKRTEHSSVRARIKKKRNNFGQCVIFIHASKMHSIILWSCS